MSRWFRHYAGMMRDDKLVSVAIKSKQSIERVAWIWGAILESAAESDDNGRYDVDPAEVAYFLRADQADVDAVFDRLADAGRVAEGHVVKWGDRQFQSDRSAVRQSAYRERKRAGDGRSDDKQTSPNNKVTSLSRHRDAPETETETDTDTDSSVANATGAVAPPDPVKALFDDGVAILTAAGVKPPAARSLIGRWRKDHGDGQVMEALVDCRARAIAQPVEWLTKRLAGQARFAAPEPEMLMPC